MFYYANTVDDEAIGPHSLDELRALRASDTITDSTLIVEVGGTTWREFGAYRPPPLPRGPRPADAGHQGGSAAAAETAAKPEAPSEVLKKAVTATFQSASTLGEKAILFGALTGLIAFFLPWASTFGQSVNGFGLATNVSGLLFLLPASFGSAVFLAYLNTTASPRDTILRARWLIAMGAFWCGIALIATIAGRGLFGVAAFGLYLTVLSTAAVAVGGILQIDEHIGSMREGG